MKLIESIIVTIARNSVDYRMLKDVVERVCQPRDVNKLPDRPQALAEQLFRYSLNPKQALTHGERQTMSRITDAIICDYDLHPAPSIDDDHRWLAVSRTRALPIWLADIFQMRPMPEGEAFVELRIERPETFTPSQFLELVKRVTSANRPSCSNRIRDWLDSVADIVRLRHPKADVNHLYLVVDDERGIVTVDNDINRALDRALAWVRANYPEDRLEDCEHVELRPIVAGQTLV